MTKTPKVATLNSSKDTVPVNLDSPEVGRQMFRVFFRISQVWALSPDQEMGLLGVSRSQIDLLKRDEPLSHGLSDDMIKRLSCITRIYAGLKVLLPIPERAAAWLRAPDAVPVFSGQAALDRLTSGQAGDLMAVAEYLESQLTGDFG